MTVICIAVDVIDTTGAEHQCNLLENSRSLVARCDLDFSQKFVRDAQRLRGPMALLMRLTLQMQEMNTTFSPEILAFLSCAETATKNACLVFEAYNQCHHPAVIGSKLMSCVE
jgi:hypothetical protein